jgi:serine/threonine protein kinase
MAQEWGNWKNVRAAGEGGQGHVFEVTPRDTGVRGAFKILKNEKRLGRFQNEISAAKSLDHPNIARLLDSDISAKRPYAVYE